MTRPVTCRWFQAGKMDQVLFLIDLCAGEEDSGGGEWLSAVYLACCRVLLCHCFSSTEERAGRSSSPESFGHHLVDTVKWSYELLPGTAGNVPGGGGAKMNKKSNSFLELKTENLVDSFYKDLVSRSHSSPLEGSSSVKSLYGGLGKCVQNYCWDTPIIMTPVPSRKKRKGRSKSCDCHVRNRMYIFSTVLCDQRIEDEIYSKTVIDKIFTNALIEQLLAKKISVHVIWIPSDKVID